MAEKNGDLGFYTFAARRRKKSIRLDRCWRCEVTNLYGAGYIPSQSTPEGDVKERHHPYVPSEISGPIPVSPASSDPHSARQQCCSFHDIYLRSRPPEGTLKEETDPEEPSQDRSLQDRSCRRCVPIESGIDNIYPSWVMPEKENTPLYNPHRLSGRER